jgi:membrane-associated phospholipid phosphatase
LERNYYQILIYVFSIYLGKLVFLNKIHNSSKPMQRGLLFIIVCSFLISSSDNLFAQTESISRVPFKMLFHKLPANSIGFITYNKGINTLVGCLGSYVLVHNNFDWEWYKFAKTNSWVSNAGWPSVTVGGLLPIALPLTMYLYGRKHHDRKLQLTGLALGQAAILSLAVSSGIKVFTGRRPPDDIYNSNDPTNYSTDFSFGFLNRGAFDGWPSSHTMIAFSMATTLTELYPDNTALKIGSYAYASLIGLGVSVNIHWFSDAFAGALMGYAIGKTVGKSFNSLLTNNYTQNSRCNFYATLNGVGFIYRFN